MGATIELWHKAIATRDDAILADLIAPDCAFQSPALHRVITGRAETLRYLRAAAQVLGTRDFRYIEQWEGARSAVLEFETRLDDIVVNGVDVIHWNDDGRINGFRVMIRPLKALQAVMGAMAAALVTDSSSY